jgi:hypothetical protein
MSDVYTDSASDLKLQNQNLLNDKQELTFHKIALDEAFMEQMQIAVNHKVTIAKLKDDAIKYQNTLKAASQTISDLQVKLDAANAQILALTPTPVDPEQPDAA